MAVFKRNLTSKVLEKAAAAQINKSGNNLSILEIGCGDGNISRNLAQKFPDNKFYASDISNEAVSLAKQLDLENKIDFRISNGIEEWLNFEFDLIICDISAISEIIADLSDWYDGVSCETGEDGLRIIYEVIQSRKKISHKKSILLIPIISLCNVKKQEKFLNDTFSSVEYSKKIEWPIPEDLLTKLENNSVNLNSDFLDVKQRFGMVVAYTCSATCYI